MHKILSELENAAATNIKKLSGLDYYTAGKAKEAMKVYDEANEKIMELYDHYSQVSALIVDVLNTMIELDENIAKQIIAKLEV